MPSNWQSQGPHPIWLKQCGCFYRYLLRPSLSFVSTVRLVLLGNLVPILLPFHTGSVSIVAVAWFLYAGFSVAWI